MVKAVTAYETADGRLFDDEDKAEAHQLDLIGETINELIRIGIVGNGNITRVDEYRICLQLLKERAAIKPVIEKLYHYLNFDN